MSTRCLVTGAVLSLGCIATPSWAASFDCAAATLTSVERAVCADEALSALDSELSSNYSALRSQATGEEKMRLVSEQKAWIAQRNRCGNTECFREAYQKRIAELAPAPSSAQASGVDDASTSPPSQGTEVISEPEIANAVDATEVPIDPAVAVSSSPGLPDRAPPRDNLAARDAPAAVPATEGATEGPAHENSYYSTNHDLGLDRARRCVIDSVHPEPEISPRIPAWIDGRAIWRGFGGCPSR